jgi:hypothetical protein
MPSDDATTATLVPAASVPAVGAGRGEAEVCSLLREADARPGRGGPLSEQRGIAWVDFAEELVPALPSAIERLGYTERVDLVRRPSPFPEGPS